MQKYFLPLVRFSDYREDHAVIKDWQQRPLEAIYVHVIIDAIHYKVRKDGKIVNKVIYIIIGISLDRMKDVLGIWVGENKTSKYGLKVLSDLQHHGVEVFS